MGFFRDLLGPRQPCDLCHLGQARWPGAHHGVADWKLQGLGLNTSFLVCGPCRAFLIETGLLYKNPMLALSELVRRGQAKRPPLQTYLQHAAWRAVWMQILDYAEIHPTDEFAALTAMRPLEEEFMAGAGSNTATGPEDDVFESLFPGYDLGPEFRRLAGTWNVPEDLVRRKYAAYAIALKTGGQRSNWNADIEEHARRIGALSEAEIAAARTDIHYAILNRVKVALISEGVISSPTGERDQQGSGPGPTVTPMKPPVASRVDKQIEREGFPHEIRVPGSDLPLTIPGVSLSEARSEEEYHQLYLTACGGAANLLVLVILERSGGAITLPLARACALDLVVKAAESNCAPSEDTEGYYIAGRALFETRWSEWTAIGDPREILAREYEDWGE